MLRSFSFESREAQSNSYQRDRAMHAWLLYRIVIIPMDVLVFSLTVQRSSSVTRLKCVTVSLPTAFMYGFQLRFVLMLLFTETTLCIFTVREGYVFTRSCLSTGSVSRPTPRGS